MKRIAFELEDYKPKHLESSLECRTMADRAIELVECASHCSTGSIRLTRIAKSVKNKEVKIEKNSIFKNLKKSDVFYRGIF